MNDSYILGSLPINYEKSIAKQRLVYKSTGTVIFSYVFGYIIMLFGILLGIAPILIKTVNRSDVPLWVIICGIVYLIWMISNLTLRENFVKIEGKDIATNKKNILATLNTYFNNLEFHIDEDKIIRSAKSSYRPIWGRVITVLLDDRFIYLNITTLGKSDSPAFIFGFSNYLKARRIAKRFKSQHP